MQVGGQEARAHSPPGSLQRHRSGSSPAGEDLLGAGGQAVYLPSLVVATIGGTTPQATDEESTAGKAGDLSRSWG